MKYTIQQFRNDYPNEDACLDKVFKLRYSNIDTCTECKQTTSFRRIPTRRCYQCTKCYHQIYPCAGTIFEKSRTPLMYWFYLMFLFTASKNGISAYEVQRQLGVTYKTTWRMLKQIRTMIKPDNDIFTGTIQCDETFVGGKNKNRHFDKKVKNSQGRSFKDKTPVMGILKGNEYEYRIDKAGNLKKHILNASKVKCFVIADTKSVSIQPIIKENVLSDSVVVSDEWLAYQGLNNTYQHRIVDHRRLEYVNDNGDTTNAIENVWSVLKRTLHGSYISVSKKYLQLYVNECVFRFNNRKSVIPIFDCLLNQV